MANVIKTVLTYPLDGSTTDFNIPFEYLARKFVVVTLLGVDRRVLTLPSDYRFATRTVIATNKAWGPADGYTQIEIRRVTSATERLVDFTDGSILRAYDLNVAQIQTMHVAEEARNMTADTIGVNNDGHLDARGRRIVNLANAVDDRDAVPFGQLKTMNQNSWQARNETLQFRNAAEQFCNESKANRDATAKIKGDTAVLQGQAAQSAMAAEQHKASASNSANAAAQSAASASRSEGIVTPLVPVVEKAAAAAAQSAMAAEQHKASAWNAVTTANEHADRSNKEANRSRDEASRAQREADRSTQQAGVSTQQAVESKKQADRSGSEADRAKGYADGMTASVAEAKKQADRSGSEANRASDGANRAAGEVAKAAAEVAKAATHVETAKGHADRANIEANRSKGEADRAKTEANRAQQAVQDVKDLGAVPVGTIAMFGTAKIPAGWLSLMADNPTFNTAEYPELAKLYPNGQLPSYKDRVPEGIGSGITLGQKRDGKVGQTTTIALSTNTVDLNHSHDFAGNTANGGSHQHSLPSTGSDGYTNYGDARFYTVSGKGGLQFVNQMNNSMSAAGDHIHQFSGTTAGIKDGLNRFHNHTISGTVGSGRNLVDATGTIFAIKAFGAIVNEGSLDASALSSSIQQTNNRVSTLGAAVGFGRKVPVGSLLTAAAGWSFADAECNVQETSSGYLVRIIFRAAAGTTQRRLCYLAAGLKHAGYTAATVAVDGVIHPGYVDAPSSNMLGFTVSQSGTFSWVMATLTLEKV